MSSPYPYIRDGPPVKRAKMDGGMEVDGTLGDSHTIGGGFTAAGIDSPIGSRSRKELIYIKSIVGHYFAAFMIITIPEIVDHSTECCDSLDPSSRRGEGENLKTEPGRLGDVASDIYFHNLNCIETVDFFHSSIMP